MRRRTNEKNETRTFSVVNEMSTRVNNGVTKSPAYNANGQQTDDGVNYTYEWDAFGRLRKVKNRSNSALVVEYTYNGLNHQIGRHADLDADGDVDNTDKWEWTIYDPSYHTWRIASKSRSDHNPWHRSRFDFVGSVPFQRIDERTASRGALGIHLGRCDAEC